MSEPEDRPAGAAKSDPAAPRPHVAARRRRVKRTLFQIGVALTLMVALFRVVLRGRGFLEPFFARMDFASGKAPHLLPPRLTLLRIDADSVTVRIMIANPEDWPATDVYAVAMLVASTTAPADPSAPLPSGEPDLQALLRVGPRSQHGITKRIERKLDPAFLGAWSQRSAWLTLRGVVASHGHVQPFCIAIQPTRPREFVNGEQAFDAAACGGNTPHQP